MSAHDFIFVVQSRIDGLWHDSIIGADTFEQAVLFLNGEQAECPDARLRIVATPNKSAPSTRAT